MDKNSFWETIRDRYGRTMRSWGPWENFYRSFKLEEFKISVMGLGFPISNPCTCILSLILGIRSPSSNALTTKSLAVFFDDSAFALHVRDSMVPQCLLYVLPVPASILDVGLPKKLRQDLGHGLPPLVSSEYGRAIMQASRIPMRRN